MEKENATEMLPPMPRKEYSQPTLVEYGSIAKLTQAGGSANGEAGGAMMI